MGGFVGHPIPALDIYAYGGAEGVASKSFSGTAGYGNPNVSLAGCEVELGSCSAVTSSVEDALRREREEQIKLLRSADAMEGILAWAQKREPEFQGE